MLCVPIVYGVLRADVIACHAVGAASVACPNGETRLDVVRDVIDWTYTRTTTTMDT